MADEILLPTALLRQVQHGAQVKLMENALYEIVDALHEIRDKLPEPPLQYPPQFVRPSKEKIARVLGYVIAEWLEEMGHIDLFGDYTSKEIEEELLVLDEKKLRRLVRHITSNLHEPIDPRWKTVLD